MRSEGKTGLKGGVWAQDDKLSENEETAEHRILVPSNTLGCGQSGRSMEAVERTLTITVCEAQSNSGLPRLCCKIEV